MSKEASKTYVITTWIPKWQLEYLLKAKDKDVTVEDMKDTEYNDCESCERIDPSDYEPQHNEGFD